MAWNQIAEQISNGKFLYEEGKFWVGLAGGLWVLFSKYTDIKEKFINVLTGVKTLQTKVEEQTASIVTAVSSNTNELKEMRGDLKMVTGALILPPQIRARARRKK